MGTSSTTYFPSEIFAGVKNNYISFFLLISYQVVSRYLDTRVKLIYFSQFTDSMKTETYMQNTVKYMSDENE